MPISKTPNQEPFPLRSKEQIQPAVTRYAPLPTAADMRKRKLFGLPLRSALTNELIDDETIEFYITAAISEIEHALDLYITPVKFKDKYDYRRDMFSMSYAYLKLDHRPILEVEKFQLSFSNDPDEDGFINFPLEFVHVMPQEGVVQLVPAFGTSLSGFLVSAFTGTQYHALQALGQNDFPGGIRVEYTAGFNPDKIPAIIINLIEILAALALLSELGPILYPYNSVSIGIDGTSQSTSNPGPNFLNTRIEQLEKEKDRQWDAVMNYYHRKFQVDAF